MSWNSLLFDTFYSHLLFQDVIRNPRGNSIRRRWLRRSSWWSIASRAFQIKAARWSMDGVSVCVLLHREYKLACLFIGANCYPYDLITLRVLIKIYLCTHIHSGTHQHSLYVLYCVVLSTLPSTTAQQSYEDFHRHIHVL